MIIKVLNQNGLYSKGGYNVSFTKKGKAWSSLGYLKSHLNQLNDKKIKENYLNCKILIIDELNSNNNETILFEDFYNEYIKEFNLKNQKKELEKLISKKNMLEKELNNIDKRKEFCLNEIKRIEKILIDSNIKLINR